MGIQQGVNAISAGVLGAAVAGKHLKQQAEAVKGAEIRELASIDKEIADRQDVADKATEAYTDAIMEANTFSKKAEDQKVDLENKLNDKRLSPYSMKYGSYVSALADIEEQESALKEARLAAEARSISADRELKIYKDRKAELEAKYGKYKW